MTPDTRLSAIRAKVEAGRRLDFDDGLALEATNDLFTLGELANLVRERKNGNKIGRASCRERVYVLV